MDIEKRIDLSTPGVAVAVAWSPDGSTLAAASDYGETLTVWNGVGHLISQFPRTGGGPALAGSLAFTDGSSDLIFPPPENATDHTALAIWDVSSGRVVKEIKDPRPGEDYSVNRTPFFDISPQGDILVAGSTYGSQTNLISYSIPGWQVLSTGNVKSGIFSLSLFDMGKLVVVGSSKGHVGIFDAMTSLQKDTLSIYEESDYGDIAVGAVAGSPDGDLVFAGAGPALISGKYANTTEAETWLSGLSSAWVFSVRDKRLVASLSGAKRPIRKAVWDPKGRYIAFVDNAGALYLWQPLVRPDAYKVVMLSSQSLSLSVSPDGGNLAVTTNSGVSLFSVK